MDPRAVLLTAFLSGATVAAPGGAALAAPGSYDVAGAYTAASAAAPCHPDPRDLAAIQSVESPSAVVDPSGHVSNPDGSPVRGDGGQSFGPFQFYEVAGTWATYGEGDPDDLLPAATATAKMLCANNYATDRHAAIARHNGSGPAAQAYADRVIAAADRSKPITAAPISSSGADGCASSGGRSLGKVLDRAWSCLVVKPWLQLGKKHPSSTWSKVDHAVFGDDAHEKAPTTPAVAAPAGAALPGAGGLDPTFSANLARLVAAAPGAVSILDGYRSVEDQIAVGGAAPDCGKWVACVTNGVCGSMHCKGLAADLRFDSDATKAWVHDHADEYGLTFRMAWEDWHIEPKGAFEAQGASS